MCEAFDDPPPPPRTLERARRRRPSVTLRSPHRAVVEFGFMRHALIGTLALALGAGPIGVFLMLRRMSLVGDAMAHTILPGAAIGFMVAGL